MYKSYITLCSYWYFQFRLDIIEFSPLPSLFLYFVFSQTLKNLDPNIINSFVYLLFFFLAIPHSLWDFSSPTRDGIKPGSRQWKYTVLTTGLPGNSLLIFLILWHTYDNFKMTTSTIKTEWNLWFIWVIFVLRKPVTKRWTLSQSPVCKRHLKYFLLVSSYMWTIRHAIWLTGYRF